MNSENERLLFPKLALIKKEIRERFLTITRFIYQHHGTYSYVEDEGKTNILIQDASGNSEQDGKLVKLIAKVGAYDYHLHDTLGSNFSHEVYQGGGVVGKATQKMLELPVTVLIQAYAEEESSDVADELAQLVVYACRKQYLAAGLVPHSAHISETGESNQEQKIFQTSVTFRFQVHWSLETIDFRRIENIFMDFVPPPSNALPSYRQPQVTVQPMQKDEMLFTDAFGKTFHMRSEE